MGPIPCPYRSRVPRERVAGGDGDGSACPQVARAALLRAEPPLRPPASDGSDSDASVAALVLFPSEPCLFVSSWLHDRWHLSRLVDNVATIRQNAPVFERLKHAVTFEPYRAISLRSEPIRLFLPTLRGKQQSPPRKCSAPRNRCLHRNLDEIASRSSPPDHLRAGRFPHSITKQLSDLPNYAADRGEI
jgi:hypothetical protein